MSLLLNKIMMPLLSPDVPSITAPMDREDILAELKKADKDEKVDDKATEETTEEVETDTEDESDETEEDELEEIEEDLEDDEEDEDKEPDDDLDLVHPVSRKAILKEYPELFKKFPYLEKAYFREQQYTKIFTTPKDAKMALEKAETFDIFDKDLVEGNIEPVFKAIKATSGNTFNKVADNLLSTLAKVDQEAFLHVTGNVIKHTIMSMVRKASARGDKNLQAAAEIVNRFVFDADDFIPPSVLYDEKAEEVNPKEKELSQREENFNKQQFQNAKNTVDTKVKGSIRHTIESHIDPRNTMPEYVKKNAVRDAVENLEELMNKSPRYRAIVNKAWDKAKKENYSDESVERVRRIHITHAKTLLDSVIKKSRDVALRGIGKRVVTKKVDTKEDKTESTVQTDRRTNTKTAKDIPPGMSSLDAWDLLEKQGR